MAPDRSHSPSRSTSRSPAARARVRELAAAVRAAGGGPGRFLFAVTADPHPDLGEQIDLYIGLSAAHLAGDAAPRWTYNGAPPRRLARARRRHARPAHLGLDRLALGDPPGTCGTRSTGTIATIATWSSCPAARSTRAPIPSASTTAPITATSTVCSRCPPPATAGRRCASPRIRRGLQDRALLELAARCAPETTALLAATLVPTALGDAPASGPPSWSTDEALWEQARRTLIALASCAP